jgi:hypothetical protein
MATITLSEQPKVTLLSFSKAAMNFEGNTIGGRGGGELTRIEPSMSRQPVAGGDGEVGTTDSKLTASLAGHTHPRPFAASEAASSSATSCNSTSNTGRSEPSKSSHGEVSTGCGEDLHDSDNIPSEHKKQTAKKKGVASSSKKGPATMDTAGGGNTAASTVSGDGDKKSSSSKNNEKGRSSSSTSIRPEDTDVLMGRGRPFQSHPGNLRLHRIVNLHKAQYVQSRRYDKLAIAERVVHEIKHGGDGLKPGRFLRKKEGTEDDWEIAPDLVAREKVSHALRGKTKQPVDNVASMSMAMSMMDHQQNPFGQFSAFGGGMSIPSSRNAGSTGVSVGSLLSTSLPSDLLAAGIFGGSSNNDGTSFSLPSSILQVSNSSTDSSTSRRAGLELGQQLSGSPTAGGTSGKPMSQILREQQLQHLYKEQEQALTERVLRLRQLRNSLGNTDLEETQMQPNQFQQLQAQQQQQRLLLLQRQQELLRNQHSITANSASMGANFGRDGRGNFLGAGSAVGLPSSNFSTQSLLHAMSMSQEQPVQQSGQQLVGVLSSQNQFSRNMGIQDGLGQRQGHVGGGGVSASLPDPTAGLNMLLSPGQSNSTAFANSTSNITQMAQNQTMAPNDHDAMINQNRQLTLEMLLNRQDPTGNQRRMLEEQLRRQLSNNTR